MIEIEEIKKLLPHRFPFLLIDRVIELEAKRGVGIKNVSINEPFFQGHFPNHPVMPGVLITEAMAQLTGIVVYKAIRRTGVMAYLVGLDTVRYREVVVPGDQLRIEVKIVKQKSKLVISEAKAMVQEKVVCEAKLMMVIQDPA